jgi:thiol-disulfide isomerase/thioredoxin
MKTRLFLFLFSLCCLAAPAAAFTVTDSRGKAHKLADYAGKWVLVNYWATWCPPCLEEIPDLIALHDNKKNNLVVLGIAMDYQNPKQVLDFAEQQMISYPIILGDAKIAAEVGPVKGLPTSYLFNPRGERVAYVVGAITRSAVESYIASKSPAAGATSTTKSAGAAKKKPATP